MKIGERIAAARNRAGMSQVKLGAAIHQAQTTISSWERGRTEPTREDVARIAAVLGVTSAELEHGPEKPGVLTPLVRRVPVVGAVQAGAWKEQVINPVDDDQTVDWVYYDNPQYKRAQLFSLNVVGPSVDLFYPDGSTVICALPHEAGVREGDFVVAQRQRGDLFETTLKQVQIGPEGVELWPRSRDPDYQEPIIVRRLVEAQEGVAIIGVVVGKQENNRMGHGPLLDLGLS